MSELREAEAAERLAKEKPIVIPRKGKKGKFDRYTLEEGEQKLEELAGKKVKDLYGRKLTPEELQVAVNNAYDIIEKQQEKKKGKEQEKTSITDKEIKDQRENLGIEQEKDYAIDAETDLKVKEESIDKASDRVFNKEMAEMEAQREDSRKKLKEYRKQEDLAYQQNDKQKQDAYRQLINQEKARENDIESAYSQMEEQRYSEEQKLADIESFKQESETAPVSEEYKNVDIDEYANRTGKNNPEGFTDEELGREMSRLQTIKDIEGGKRFKPDVEKESAPEDVQEQASEFENVNELLPEQQNEAEVATEPETIEGENEGEIEGEAEIVEEVTPAEPEVEGATEDVVQEDVQDVQQEPEQVDDYTRKSQVLFDMHRDGKLNDAQLQERLDILADQSWDKSPSQLVSPDEQQKLIQEQEREVAESFVDKEGSDAVAGQLKSLLKKADEEAQVEPVYESFSEKEAPATGQVRLTERQTNVVVRSLKNSFKSLKNVEVLKDQKAVNELLGSERKPMEGFVTNGKIYLVAENLRGRNTTEAVNRAVEVFYHEGIGHEGLRSFMDKNGGFDNFLDSFGKHTRNKAKLRKWLSSKRGQQYKDKSQRVQIEEYIASEFAEKGVRGVGTLEAVAESIRRVMGIKGSETALRQALQKVQKELQNDKSSTLLSGLGRSRKPTDQPETLPNAEDVVGRKVSLNEFNETTDEGVRASYLAEEHGLVFPLKPRQERIFSFEEAQTMGGIKAAGKERTMKYIEDYKAGLSPVEIIRNAKNNMMSRKDVYDIINGEEVDANGKAVKSSFNPNKYSDEEAVFRLHLGGTIRVDGQAVGKGYTAHPVTTTGKPEYSKAMFYGPGFNITDGTFQVDQNKRRDIALGVNKKGDKQTKVPMAGVQGKLTNTPLSTEGKQIIFDPKTVHLFTEASTGLAVKGFKGEASAIGSTVYVRGELEYYNRDNMPAPVDDVPSSSIPDETQAVKAYNMELSRIQNSGSPENDLRESFMGEIIDAANPAYKEPFIQKAKSVGQVIAKYADAATNPVALIPKMEKYLKGRNKIKGRIDRLSDYGKQIYDILKKATPEQGERIFQYLTTVNADPTSIPEMEFRDVAVEIKNGIERIGEQAVNSGVLAREQVNALKGQYLPRVYMKYLLNEENSAFNQVLRSDLKVDGGWFQGRKNIEESIRKIFLGEIEDPAYLAQKGIVTPGRDLAIIDFMDWISEEPSWAYQEQFVEFDTKNKIYELAREMNDEGLGTSLISDFGLQPNDKPLRTTPNYLIKEGERIKEQLKFFQENGGKETEKYELMNRLANAMMDEGKDLMKSITDEAEAAGFVKMPDLKKYGKLRGMYVNPDIKEDLTGAQVLSDEAPNWLKQLVGEGGTIAKYGSIFKLSKTALNFPAGHVRNFISAASLAYFADVPITKLPKLVARAFKEIRTRGRYYDMAKERGLMTAGFIAEEVKRVEIEYLNGLKQNAAKGPWEQFWLSTQLAASKLGNKAGDLYQFGDEINRLVVLMDQVENKGIDPDTAAVHANKWIMDYSLARSWVKYGRTAVIGAPFLTYTAKIIPLMLETAVTKPTKFILPYALGHGMMQFTMSQFDWDDEDVDAYKLSLADYLRSKANAGLLPPAIIPVPWKDNEGRIQFWDASYVYPWGIINELWSEMSEGEIDQVLRTLGIMGGPLPQTLSAIMQNRDPFTQKEIVEKWMEPGDKIYAWSDYMWNLMSPPFMHGSLTMFSDAQRDKGFGALSRAFRTDEFVRGTGDPQKTALQVAGQAVGFNLTAVDAKTSRERNIRNLERELNDIKSERRQVIQSLNRNKRYRDAAEQAKEFNERIKKKQEEIRDYKKQTQRVLR